MGGLAVYEIEHGALQQAVHVAIDKGLRIVPEQTLHDGRQGLWFSETDTAGNAIQRVPGRDRSVPIARYWSECDGGLCWGHARRLIGRHWCRRGWRHGLRLRFEWPDKRWLLD